ncbi:MAG: hypothetical protein HFE52_01850 [Clostridia bacterium]|nr:hypothetical protein [Clostridia bacterium]
MNMTDFEERLVKHGKNMKNHISAPFDIESEELTMTKKHKTIKGILCVAAVITALLGTTVFAAYHLMTASEIAEKADYNQLAGVLTENDTSFDIAPQQCGDYTVELLGITTGKNLSNFTEDVSNDDRTYIVGAISRTDGKPLPDYAGLMLTPLISGYKPWDVNIFTLGGGKSEFISDDNMVDYFVYECDSLEMFADHTVYIAVYGGISPDGASAGFAPSSDIFTMDGDGSIRFADSYKGDGAIFTVPFDKSKADPQKASEVLKGIGKNPESLNKNVNEEIAEDEMANNADITEQVEMVAE